MAAYTDLNTAPRILLGPGPSMVHPRVLRTMATPLVGHLDPQFVAVMDDVKGLLRHVFQTTNELTIPVSGTGSAGMEASLVNFLEPGLTLVNDSPMAQELREQLPAQSGLLRTDPWVLLLIASVALLCTEWIAFHRRITI